MAEVDWLAVRRRIALIPLIFLLALASLQAHDALRLQCNATLQVRRPHRCPPPNRDICLPDLTHSQAIQSHIRDGSMESAARRTQARPAPLRRDNT